MISDSIKAEIMDIRDELESLAKRLRALNDKGVAISFNLDVPNGAVSAFSATEMTPIDLTNATRRKAN